MAKSRASLRFLRHVAVDVRQVKFRQSTRWRSTDALWEAAGGRKLPRGDRSNRETSCCSLRTTTPAVSARHSLTTIAMARPICRNGSSRALRSIFDTSRTNDAAVPTFLAPAFARGSPAQTSSFSTTSQCRSKIGRAPLSLPPEVTFTVMQMPSKGQGMNISRQEPESVAEITGPRGKMSVTIPPYMSIFGNEESRTQTLSVLDEKDKRQRTMWGKLWLTCMPEANTC